MEVQVKDKVCVVTGAASGIGHQIAVTLAQAGGKVCVVDVQKEKAEASAAEVGGKAYLCDLRSVAELKRPWRPSWPTWPGGRAGERGRPGQPHPQREHYRSRVGPFERREP